MKTKVNQMKNPYTGIAQAFCLDPDSFRSFLDSGKGMGFKPFRAMGYGSQPRGKGSWRPSYKGGFKGKGATSMSLGARCSYSLFSQGEKSNDFLEAHGVPSRSEDFDKKRGGSSMDPAPNVSDSIAQKPGRGAGCRLHHEGVPRGGGCHVDPSSPVFGNKAFGSMVCFYKDRVNMKTKASSHSRLQTVKQTFGNKKFRIGSLAPYFSSFEKKHVGHKGGFEACLLSVGTQL